MSHGPPALPSLLDRAAAVIGIAVVVARLTMLETVRDPFEVVPGGSTLAGGPGAGQTVLLNLLTAVPALLVLVRRCCDATRPLRFGAAHAAAMGLGVWAMGSAAWASDRFVALVSGSTLLAGATLLFAASNLVRTWRDLRVGCGVAVGLLAVLCAHAIIYRFVDVPEMARSWEQHRAAILAERGWEEGSFAARQFERKVLGGELVGFMASPNTLGATTVLLATIAAGLLWQRRRDGDPAGWTALPGLLLPAAAGVVWLTGSRAAMTAAALAAVAAFGLARLHALPPPRARVWTLRVAAAVALGIAGVVAFGLYHGSLPSDSLNFRWRYWTGSAGVLAESPVVGVGWGNFGNHYLAHRLPQATEEIKDPHNLLVRWACELGAVGLLLGLAMLCALGGALMKPADLGADAPPPRPSAGAHDRGPLRLAAWLVLPGSALGAVAGVDWFQTAPDIALELMKRLLYAAALFIAVLIASLRSHQDVAIDDRPANLLRAALAGALAVFVVQNLVDFALSENGVTLLAAMLAGIAVGAGPAAPARSRAAAVSCAVASSLAWLAFAVALATPVLLAERTARRGDRLLQDTRPRDAAERYGTAFGLLPFDNAEYAYRAARALAFARERPDDALAWITRAVQADQRNPRYPAFRAGLLRAIDPSRTSEIDTDLRRVTELNPHDLSARQAYGDWLDATGRREEADAQHRAALRVNDALDATEPERLDGETERRLRARLGL